jgi:cell division septation protein DedD
MNDKGLPSGKQYVYAFSSGKLVLLLAMVLILMALSFMLGIRIERFQKAAALAETEVMPPATITLKPSLPSVEEESQNKKAAETPASAEEAQEKGAETPAAEAREEQREIDEEAASSEEVSAPPAEQPKEKPKAVVETKEAASPPLPKPAPKKKAVQPAPAVTSGHFGVQVSSSQDPKMAALQVAELKKKGFPSFTEETVIEKKGKFYRVLVGPYPNEAEAATALSKLKKDANFVDSYIRSLP